MYLQTYSMGWSFKILYSINYTFTLFSEITKLDCFVKHHNIYTNEFFNVQIHRKSPVSKTFFQKDHLQKDKNTICRCVTTKHNRGVLGAVKNCLWSILSRPPKLPPFTRGKNQIPVALTWSFQCHQGLLSASATWFQACEAAEPQTLLSARHRFEGGWWNNGVSIRTPASTKHSAGFLPHPPTQMPQKGKNNRLFNTK